MIDIVEEPKSLVLQYLDDHLLNVSKKQRLEGPELRFVARRVLEALTTIHETGYVHTGKFTDLYHYLLIESYYAKTYLPQNPDSWR